MHQATFAPTQQNMTQAQRLKHWPSSCELAWVCRIGMASGHSGCLSSGALSLLQASLVATATSLSPRASSGPEAQSPSRHTCSPPSQPVTFLASHAHLLYLRTQSTASDRPGVGLSPQTANTQGPGAPALFISTGTEHSSPSPAGKNGEWVVREVAGFLFPSWLSAFFLSFFF